MVNYDEIINFRALKGNRNSSLQVRDSQLMAWYVELGISRLINERYVFVGKSLDRSISVFMSQVTGVYIEYERKNNTDSYDINIRVLRQGDKVDREVKFLKNLVNNL